MNTNPWPELPRIEPLTTPLARLKHDPHCSYVLRGDGDCDCVAQIPHNVEPPIAAQDKVRRKLRDLRIEEAELTELLATNRALQLQYEANLIPF